MEEPEEEDANEKAVEVEEQEKFSAFNTSAGYHSRGSLRGTSFSSTEGELDNSVSPTAIKARPYLERYNLLTT